MKKLTILLVILVSGLIGLGIYNNQLNKQAEPVKTEVSVIDEVANKKKVDELLIDKIIEYYQVGNRYKEVLKVDGNSYSFYRLPFTYFQSDKIIVSAGVVLITTVSKNGTFL